MDAVPALRRSVHKFSSNVVDWRWECMEDATSDELTVLKGYRERYDANVLSQDSALNLKVQSGLFDPIHEILSLILRMISRCVGLTYSCLLD